MDAEQFLTANLYELSLFKTSAHAATLEKLVILTTELSQNMKLTRV